MYETTSKAIPKLIAVDVDGTIVDYQDKEFTLPSQETVNALSKARDAGVPVAIVTGRAAWGGARIAHQLGLPDGFASCSHGAVEYSIADRTVSHREFMDTTLAVKAFQAARPDVEFAFEWDLEGWYHTPGFERNFAANWAEIRPLEELVSRPAARFVARVPSTNTYGFGQRCEAAVGLANSAALNPQLYYVEPGFNGWIDVSPPGKTKATGLARIAAHYGVDSSEVIVFGDAHNDLPMFEWAGHAVAMGQASDEVKAAADEVTRPVSENGVAAVLSRWF